MLSIQHYQLSCLQCNVARPTSGMSSLVLASCLAREPLIFIMRKVEKKYQAKKKLYYAFADLKKKFDRVPREVLRWVLRKMGVDELALYPEVCTVVRTYVGLSEGGSESRVSCCMLMSCYLWHQQWNSSVDM